LHTRAAGFRQADGNSLLRGTGAVLPFPNVMYFLAHEFSSLRARRLAFFLAPLRPL
jgi:hypothetical protein